MRPLFLHLDDALSRQPGLLAAGREAGATTLDARTLGPALRLWARPRPYAELKARLAQKTGEGVELAYFGSGDFHNVTPLLLERALARHGGPTTVVHFDNHPDWVRFGEGVHCGSWVARAARLPGVARILTVGVCSRDILPAKHKGAETELIADGRLEMHAWRDPAGEADHVQIAGRRFDTICAQGEADFIARLLGRIPTATVYVTLDKDVLRPEDAATNWDQGEASLAFVEACLSRILERHALIGADVTGDWSPPEMGGGMIERWVKRVEGGLDHARPPSSSNAAAALNEATNLRLLGLFQAPAA